MSRAYILTTISLIFLLIGCAEEEKGDSKNTESFASLMSAQDCGKIKSQICNEGLSFVKIGDSIPLVTIEGFSVTSVKDTLISTEDYEAYGKIFFLSQGSIVLEGAPLEKDAATTGPDQSHVKSIRILSPLFETPEKIKVGSTFADLKAVYPDSLFEVQPGSAGILEIKMPRISSSVNYMIRPIRPNTEEAPDPNEIYSTASIPVESKIEEITLY